MHARDKRAAHALGNARGRERTAVLNDNGYGYCGPLVESWHNAMHRAEEAQWTRGARGARHCASSRLLLPGFIRSNTSRNISATQVSYFIVVTNNDPGLLSANPSLSLGLYSTPRAFCISFRPPFGQLAVDFLLIKILSSIENDKFWCWKMKAF